jgi:hypothetical protein
VRGDAMFFDYGPAALLGSDTRLYRLAVDPGRNSPFKDSAPGGADDTTDGRQRGAAGSLCGSEIRIGDSVEESRRRRNVAGWFRRCDHRRGIAFSFCTGTLPHLQIRHDFRSCAGVFGIEPCTSAKTDGVEQVMQPRSNSPV